MEKFMEHTQAKDGSLSEQQRLEGQHEVILYHMGKAIYAPVDLSKPGLQILDSGCANGRWLLDLKASSPAKHEYYGTDIDEGLYPKPPAEGMHFQNASIKENFPAEWNGKFDLIHQRFVMPGAAPNTPKSVVEKLAAMLRPGGWLQLIEMDTSPNSKNADSPMMAQFIAMLYEMFGFIGVGSNFALDMKGAMEQAGLVDVEEKLVYVAHGNNIGDKSLKAKSIVSPVDAVGPVTQVFQALPNSFKPEQIDGFDARLRQELEQKGGWSKIQVVWGRKP